MLRNKFFLLYVLLIYFSLCFFQYLNFRSNFIAEELAPFLDFVPKIISRIDPQGQNIYSTYVENISPEEFTGRLHYSAGIKRVICYDNNLYDYYWQLQRGVVLPIMRNEGTGNPFYYIHKIFFGDNYNLDLLRLHMYILGAFILFITWLFLKDFLNPESAHMALILLGTSLPFLSHLAWLRFPDTYTFLLQLIILLLFWKFHSTKKIIYFYLGFFMIGIALYVKLTVLWMLFGLLVLFFVYKLKFKLKPYVIIISALLLLLGCLLLVIYNIDSLGGSINGIRYRLLDGALSAANKFSIPGNFMLNIRYFLKLALSSFPLETYFLTITFLLFILAIRRDKEDNRLRKRIAFLWQMSFLMLLFILGTSYRGNDSYGINLLNFFIIPEAATVVFLLQGLNIKTISCGGKIISIPVIGILIFNILSAISPVSRPGLFFFSGQKEKTLTKYLEENNIYEPVCFEYRFVGMAEFLSSGRIRPLHYFPVFNEIKNQKEKIRFIKEIVLNNHEKKFIVSMYPHRENEPFFSELVELSINKEISLSVEKIIQDRIDSFLIVKLQVID